MMKSLKSIKVLRVRQGMIRDYQIAQFSNRQIKTTI